MKSKVRKFRALLAWVLDTESKLLLDSDPASDDGDDENRPNEEGPGTRAPSQSAGGESLTSFANNSAAKVQTMWTYRRVAIIEIWSWSCGCIGGWSKFLTGEGEHEVFDFIEEVCDGQYPSYTAFDRACRLVLTAQSPKNPHLRKWLQRTHAIVDSFHYERHSTGDVLCREFCNPAPLDGSHPDLVVPLVMDHDTDSDSGEEEAPTRRLFRRAFNTEVRFLSILAPDCVLMAALQPDLRAD